MSASLMLTFAILAGGRGEAARGVTVRTSNAVTVTDNARGLFTRVRSTQRFMIALIREGYDRSPAFRDLVDHLQQANVIVFVQPASCAGGRIRSCLVSVNGSSRERHIRINVDTHASHEWLIATVAHELQHAVEIAEHPEVIDASTTLKLYRQIAFGRCREGLSEECETARALATEGQVLEELYRHTTRGSLTALPGAPTALPSPRVRSTDAMMLGLLREGIARSVTFRGLVDAIAQSTGIVYIESGHCAFGHLNGCLLPFIASSRGDWSGGARVRRADVAVTWSQVVHPVSDPTPLRITRLPVGRRASGFVRVTKCLVIRIEAHPTNSDLGFCYRLLV